MSDQENDDDILAVCAQRDAMRKRAEEADARAEEHERQARKARAAADKMRKKTSDLNNRAVSAEGGRDRLRRALERLLTWLESVDDAVCGCEVDLECALCEARRVLDKPEWPTKAKAPTAKEIRGLRVMRNTLFGNMKEKLAAEGVDAGILDVVLRTMDEEDEIRLKPTVVKDDDEGRKR